MVGKEKGEDRGNVQMNKAHVTTEGKRGDTDEVMGEAETGAGSVEVNQGT